MISGTLRQNLDPFEQTEDAALNDALRAAGLFALQDEAGASRITLDTKISGGGSNLSTGQRQILALARAMIRESKVLILDEGAHRPHNFQNLKVLTLTFSYLCHRYDIAGPLVSDINSVSLDYKTDAIIQSTLRSQFDKNVSVITIAHRLQTIMDADKIVCSSSNPFLKQELIIFIHCRWSLITVASWVHFPRTTYQLLIMFQVEFDKPADLLKREKSVLLSMVEGSGEKETLFKFAGL